MTVTIKSRPGRTGPENRRAARQRVTGPALILGPKLEVSCIIRDLSSTGARVEVPSVVKLPPAFNLLLLKTNSSRHVLLRWRRGDFAGVEFVLPPGAAAQDRK